MSNFRKYDHVERVGHPDVEGIDIGTVHIFPKLDGTNASVWLEMSPCGEVGTLGCGSRRREITPKDDNHGFAKWAHDTDIDAGGFHRLTELLVEHPTWVLYGEWLVPHTLKTYRDDTWRKFYVFDVWDRATERYVPFDEYAHVLDDAGVNVIWPLAIATNPRSDQIIGWAEGNTFLVKEGEGPGEGVVLKNYAWTNKHGRQPWAKHVRGEFKEKHGKAMGVPEPDGGFQVELAAVEELLTAEMVQKTLTATVMAVAGSPQPTAKISSLALEHRAKVIPRLLETVYHDFVVEETWTILKKWKAHQTIDFKRLRSAVVAKTKTYCPELF